MHLPPPTNQTASILQALINEQGVSEMKMRMNGFRSRISELRHTFGLNIRFVEKEFVNRFGHKSRYREHFLRNSDKEKARRVYGEVNG